MTYLREVLEVIGDNDSAYSIICQMPPAAPAPALPMLIGRWDRTQARFGGQWIPIKGGPDENPSLYKRCNPEGR